MHHTLSNGAGIPISLEQINHTRQISFLRMLASYTEQRSMLPYFTRGDNRMRPIRLLRMLASYLERRSMLPYFTDPLHLCAFGAHNQCSLRVPPILRFSILQNQSDHLQRLACEQVSMDKSDHPVSIPFFDTKALTRSVLLQSKSSFVQVFTLQRSHASESKQSLAASYLQTDSNESE